MSSCVMMITLYRIPKTPLESILGDKEPLFLQRLLNAFLYSPCPTVSCLTFRTPAISSDRGGDRGLPRCTKYSLSMQWPTHLLGAVPSAVWPAISSGWPRLRAGPPKRPLLHMQPLEGRRAALCADLPLSVTSALNLDFNLGLTCCYICIQLIFQGCGGGVMLLWQPNNSGPEDRRNGISGLRPPEDSETPISALFHRNESWDATINRPLFSFYKFPANGKNKGLLIQVFYSHVIS